jgi:hypothetical protein
VADALDTQDLGVRQRPRRKVRMTIAEVARMRGTTKVAANEWLLRNAKAHMLKVDGVWTVPTAVVTRLVQVTHTEKLLSRIQALEERVDLMERRLNVLAQGHR